MAIQIHYWSGDVERLLAHYVDVLSFELLYRQPKESPADFCILGRDAARIMIARTPDAGTLGGRNDGRLLAEVAPRVGRPGPVSVYVGVEDVDAYYRHVAAAGGDVVEPIWDAPWGLRQFSVLDPDGNQTTFHGA